MDGKKLMPSSCKYSTKRTNKIMAYIENNRRGKNFKAVESANSGVRCTIGLQKV